MKRVTLYDACGHCGGLGHRDNCSCSGTIAFLRGCCRSCKGEGSRAVGVGMVGDDGKMLKEIRQNPDGKTLTVKDGNRTYIVERRKIP